MAAALDRLRERLGQVTDLSRVQGLVAWDQETMMPPGGAAQRASQLATLERIRHELFVADETGELLEEAGQQVEGMPHDSDDASLVRVARRDYDKARRVPADLAAETASVTSEAANAWVAARAASDYAAFRPWLDRVLELKRRYGACFDPGDDPYDVFLDDFEPGLPTATVREAFARLRPELVELTRAAASPDPDPLERGPWPRAGQERVSLAVARAFGADERCFRLDPTTHPFCQSVAIDDIRLTTRYPEDDLAAHSLFSTMHEVGHGLYEHGIAAALERTPLASGCSSALHESQSRLWENAVGRSLPFWRWFYPTMQDAFPKLLADVPLERFHRAVNRVRPSYIRVEADEVTYGLHVILRFELEQELLSGALSTADLPGAWNARFEEYLGIPVPDDARGCLQDTHWSWGLFGYFPTYLLGTVLSAQIWERVQQALPAVEEHVERGEFGPLREWLTGNLYALGRKLTPAETIERVAGGPIDPEPYLRYLRSKTAALAGG